MQASLTIEKLAFFNLEGISPSQTRLRGRCVVPKLLPIAISKGSRGKATIIDSSSGIQVSGDFIVVNAIQSQWEEAAIAYGALIEGDFIQSPIADQVDNFSPFN